MRTISDSLEHATVEQLRFALGEFLAAATIPAFGALTKRDLELLILEALVRVGYLPPAPSVYELIQLLRVSRSRARGLIYDRELRRQTPETLDEQARSVLSHPLLQNQGFAVALDVESPVLADHIREKLRTLGHTSDGSFSPNLIRLSDAAAATLVESLVDESDRGSVLDALHRAGVVDKTLKGAIRAVVTKAASRLADEAGGAIAGDLVDYFGPMFAGKGKHILAVVAPLFAETLRNQRQDPA